METSSAILSNSVASLLSCPAIDVSFPRSSNYFFFPKVRRELTRTGNNRRVCVINRTKPSLGARFVCGGAKRRPSESERSQNDKIYYQSGNCPSKGVMYRVSSDPPCECFSKRKLLIWDNAILRLFLWTSTSL